MGLEEWVIRTIGILGIVNLFIAGLYLFLRGYYTNYMLKHHWLRKRAFLERGSKLQATIRWDFRGEAIYAIEPSLFTFRKREMVHIFVSPDGYNFRLNSFAKNGLGTLLLGSTLIAASLVLFLLCI